MADFNRFIYNTDKKNIKFVQSKQITGHDTLAAQIRIHVSRIVGFFKKSTIFNNRKFKKKLYLKYQVHFKSNKKRNFMSLLTFKKKKRLFSFPYTQTHVVNKAHC